MTKMWAALERAEGGSHAGGTLRAMRGFILGTLMTENPFCVLLPSLARAAASSRATTTMTGRLSNRV